MAVDKKGRKLPKGIRQRGQTYEGRLNYAYKGYTVHGRTIGETQKALTDLKYRLEHGMYVNNSRQTFEEWFHIWMNEYKKNQVKVGTYLSYQKYYEGMIKEPLGKKQINSIRGDDIQKLYNEWTKDGYALSTIKIALAVLNGCFKQAHKNGIIERNPVKLAQLPREKAKTKKKAMTKEQQQLFMEYAKDSYLYNFFAIMLRTGMRSGEMRGLIYALDVDKKAGVIHVQRTLKYENLQDYEISKDVEIPKEYEDKIGTAFFTDVPKTATSLRDIPLTNEIEKYLDAQRNYWRFPVEKINRFLFCTEEGEPLSRERVQGEINRIIRRIRADGYDFPRITSHIFRHTFATRAIEAGMQPQVLKTILGHSSLAMTMDLYSHVLPDTKSEEMNKISKAF